MDPPGSPDLHGSALRSTGGVGDAHLELAKPTTVLYARLSQDYPPVPYADGNQTGSCITTAWTPQVAGGCPKFPSWASNPQFHIVVSRPTTVSLELTQELATDGRGYGIGLVVVKADHATEPKTTVSKPEMVAYSRPFKAVERIQERVSLLPRMGGLPYICVPTTYEPSQCTAFTLSITADGADPGLRFGWLGDARPLFQAKSALAPSLSAPVDPAALTAPGAGPGGLPASSAPGSAAHAAGAAPGAGSFDEPEHEVRMESEGQALSKAQERELKAMVARATKWTDDHNGALYEDPDFPAEAKSIGTPAAGSEPLPSVTAWLRPQDTRSAQATAKETALFEEGMPVSGVVNGCPALGHGWFVNACNVIAGSKEAVERVFYFPRKPGTTPPAKGAYRGFYVVGFYADDPASDDDWELVLVDDRLPCGADGDPVFSHCASPGSWWVAILEKAYAKLAGSYTSMRGGTVREGLELLTGTPPSVLDLTTRSGLAEVTGGAAESVADLSTVESRAQLLRAHPGLWQRLLEALKAQPPKIVGCVFKAARGEAKGKLAVSAAEVKAREQDGILPGAVYCVTGVLNYDGVRLMRLRQLQGAPEWNGRWSDNSELWTANMKSMLNSSRDASDGTFWMQYEDFVATFNKVYSTRMANDLITRASTRARWRGRSAGGGEGYATWRLNPQWIIRAPPRATTLSISLSLMDPRRTTGNGRVGLTTLVGYSVYKGHAASEHRRRRLLEAKVASLVFKAEPKAVRKRVAAVPLEPSSTPYVLVAHTAAPNKEAAFKLTVVADDVDDDGAADFGMEPVRKATDWKEACVEVALDPAHCATQETDTFYQNPQYELMVAKEGPVFIFVEAIGADVAPPVRWAPAPPPLRSGC